LTSVVEKQKAKKQKKGFSAILFFPQSFLIKTLNNSSCPNPEKSNLRVN
jgi:hypothetical protein